VIGDYDRPLWLLNGKPHNGLDERCADMAVDLGELELPDAINPPMCRCFAAALPGVPYKTNTEDDARDWALTYCD
jgi:hypothetical protein